MRTTVAAGIFNLSGCTFIEVTTTYRSVASFAVAIAKHSGRTAISFPVTEEAVPEVKPSNTPLM